MATFRLPRFSEPDALKGIDPSRLRALLLPYSAYFQARGIELPQDGELDYEALVDVLMTPDDSVPTGMVDALYLVHALATADGMDRLLKTARSKKITLDLNDKPTPADVAVAVWLASPVVLEEQHAETIALRPKSFDYYSGAVRRRRPFPHWDAAKEREIAAALNVWFVEHQRGDTTKVFVFEHTDKVLIVVRHGATMRREGSLTNGKRSTEYFRPEIHDVLVYDKGMDLIGLRAGTKSEKTLYREVFGALLFGDRDYFATRFEMNLEPLREKGPAILACDTIPGMSEVVLVETIHMFGGPTKHRQINRATDLFKAYGANWSQRLGFGRLIGATFEVTLGSGKFKRKRRVTISPPNYAKFDRDEDADTIEAWLKLHGIMPTAEGDDVVTATAPSLASAGGPARPADGTTGLAASPG